MDIFLHRSEKVYGRTPWYSHRVGLISPRFPAVREKKKKKKDQQLSTGAIKAP